MYKSFLSALVLFFIFANSALAADIYKWRTPDGRTIYSDSPPHPDAQKIEYQFQEQKPTNQAKPVINRQPVARNKQSSNKKKQSTAYTAIQITSPQHKETFQNIGAELTITAQITPPLEPADDMRIVILLDNQQVANTNQTTIKLTKIYRGEHTIKALLKSPDGQTIVQSDTIIFYVHQSIQR